MSHISGELVSVGGEESNYLQGLTGPAWEGVSCLCFYQKHSGKKGCLLLIMDLTYFSTNSKSLDIFTSGIPECFQVSKSLAQIAGKV